MPLTAFAAVSTYETEVINTVGVGDVNISLSEYELDDNGNEIPYENQKQVLPGQKVDKIVRITNKANTAWIRAKLEYTSADGINRLSDEMVSLSSDRWIKAGDYYYYKEALDKNASIDFIDKVMIPPEWDESYAEKSFSIVVTANAVQTKNFTPDFTSDDPWFGTVIETCVHSAYDTKNVGQQDFSVSFEGGAEGLVKVGDNFFGNWGTLMPGDVVTDTVDVKNSYHKPVTMYFRTETIADDILLKALKLQIKNGEAIIYDGTLDGVIQDHIKLAYLKPEETATLTYTLTVPAKLNNEYAMASTKTKWIFFAELRTSSGGGGGGSVDGSYSGGNTPPGGPGEPDHTNQTNPPNNTDANKGIENTLPDIIEKTKEWVDKHIPKMGDTNIAYYALGAMGISALGIVALNRKRREKDSHAKKI